jgi:hypothetical protein
MHKALVARFNILLQTMLSFLKRIYASLFGWWVRIEGTTACNSRVRQRKLQRG